MTPPYRVGLWEGLGEYAELLVIAVQGDDTFRVQKVRGSEWLTKSGKNYEAINLKTYKMRRGETTFHLAPKILELVDLIRKSDVVVIGGWSSPVYLQFMFFSRILGKPYLIFHESTDDSAQFRGWKLRFFKSHIFRSANAVVVPGKSSRRSVLNLGVPKDKVVEGFNSVDMDLFARRSPLSDIVRSELARKPHRYLYVGQLIERKRVDLLVREFCSFRRPGDRLSIAGKGPQQDKLMQLVNFLGLCESVDFLGEVAYSDLPEVFHAHHTLVLPSKTEVWGLVVNEALSAGLHVVVSRQCGVAASVEHMDGVYVWDEDKSALGSLMHESAISWNGPVMDPQILKMTNARFADVIWTGVLKTMSKSRAKRDLGPFTVEHG